MRPRVANLGAVEWVFVFLVLVLIVAEAAAFQGGLGWYATVIAIGYVMALVTAYLLYRHDRVAAQSGLGMPGALNDVDIFKGLTNREIEAVASVGKRIHVPDGKVLGRAGEIGSHLYIIVDGRVQLSAPSSLGEITVRIAGPGESFPLATVINSGTLITTATAMTDAELLAIHRADLLALWRQNPALGMRMFASIAQVLANRYRNTLAHLSSGAEQALTAAGFWANV